MDLLKVLILFGKLAGLGDNELGCIKLLGDDGNEEGGFHNVERQ